jgi:hypothetical protein
MACLAARSGNVRLTRGSIFFSARSAKILGKILAQRLRVLLVQHGDAVERATPPAQARTHE